MRVLAKTVTTLLLLFFLASPSTAEIKSIKIRSDNRPMILFEKFGFTQTGYINITVSSMSFTSTSSQPNASLLGFFLLKEQSLIDVLHELQQNPYFCVLSSNFISLLFTFQDLPVHTRSSFKKSHPVTYAAEYSLFFANCNPESVVTMDVRTEMFNINDHVTNNYLSVGLTQLPSLYFISSFVYLCFLGFWIFLCFKKLRSLHWVHILMLVLLTTKAVSLFCAAEYKYYVKVTGTSPHGWNILLYILQFINRLLLFTVIILIGAGWPYLKPTLLKKEKKVLMIVITLQVLANVASIVIEETGPFVKDWVTWNQVFLLADVVCCCVVVVPIAWSIRSVTKTDEKGARNLSLFRRFCVVVIGYLLVTRVGVFALKINVGYKEQWICSAAEEITNFVFYLVMFYMFRPVRESDYYLVVDNEGEYEEATQMVKG